MVSSVAPGKTRKPIIKKLQKKKKKKASRLTGQVRNIMSDSCVGFTLKVPKKESSEIDLGFWFSPLYLGKDTDCCLSGKP